MRHRLGIAALAVTLLAASASPGSAAERRYTLGSFDAVRVDGAVRVTIATGGNPAAIASGDAATLDALDVRVQGGTLYVRQQRRTALSEARRTAPGPQPLPELRIAARNVARLALVGSGEASLDRLTGNAASVTLDGPGSVAVGAIDAARLQINLNGGGTMRLAGRAGDTVAVVRGDGALAAAGLVAGRPNVVAEGFVTLTLGAEGPARLTAHGDALVVIQGAERCRIVETGNNRIACGDRQDAEALAPQDAEADAATDR